jgi:hypothetical protein
VQVSILLDAEDEEHAKIKVYALLNGNKGIDCNYMVHNVDLNEGHNNLKHLRSEAKKKQKEGNKK